MKVECHLCYKELSQTEKVFTKAGCSKFEHLFVLSCPSHPVEHTFCEECVKGLRVSKMRCPYRCEGLPYGSTPLLPIEFVYVDELVVDNAVIKFVVLLLSFERVLISRPREKRRLVRARAVTNAQVARLEPKVGQMMSRINNQTTSISSRQRLFDNELREAAVITNKIHVAYEELRNLHQSIVELQETWYRLTVPVSDSLSVSLLRR